MIMMMLIETHLTAMSTRISGLTGDLLFQELTRIFF